MDSGVPHVDPDRAEPNRVNERVRRAARSTAGAFAPAVELGHSVTSYMTPVFNYSSSAHGSTTTVQV